MSGLGLKKGLQRFGLGFGLGATVNPDWYGVEWLTTDLSPDVTRIASSVSAMSLHASLPIQSKRVAALKRDDGSINYYLKADDWSKKVDGTASDLTGIDGQVMVKNPAHYAQYVTAGFLRQVKWSEQMQTGFHFVDTSWTSAYEAALNRTNLKLASVVNTTADYRGGNNNAAWDAAANSLLGQPATNTSRTNYRTYARNRGAGWQMYTYQAHKEMWWSFVIEFATRDSQKPVNAALTVDGYKQGGIGIGVTDANSSEWSAFNSYSPFIPCGASNSLGNSSGEVSKIIPDFGGVGVNKTFAVNRYRGVEMPFGHIWKNCDGINIKIQSDAAGGLSEAWTSDNPATWNDSNYVGYANKGLLPRANGYISEAIFGDGGEFLPKVAAGGSSTYYCDYFYTSLPATGEDLRTLLLGGHAFYGSVAGFGSARSYYSPADAYTNFGSRLCFLGA